MRSRTTTVGRRALLLAALLAVPLAAVGPTPARQATAAEANDASAEAFIDRVGARTVAILSDASLDVPKRVVGLKQVLDESTDTDYVASVILGRHRRAASEAQRAEYRRLFDALVLQAMAERIGGYGGQTFETTSSRAIDERDTLVSTVIGQPGSAAPFRVDWRVRRGEDGRFRLIDIVAEGVSLVLTQRSEADEIVNRSGLDGLLGEMRRRLESRNVTGGLPTP